MTEYETVKTISSGKLFHKCMTIREKQAKRTLCLIKGTLCECQRGGEEGCEMKQDV